MPNIPIFNTFADNSLDRSGNFRKNPEWISSQMHHPKAKFIPMFNLMVPIQKQKNFTNIKYCNLSEISNYLDNPLNSIFLGTKKSVPYFASDISKSNIVENLNNKIVFEELRKAAMFLSNEDASMLALARSMTEWKLNNKYCPKCGHKTEPLSGGNAIICKNKICKKEIFPRTDPVVIMLVYHKDKCVLGRQQYFPKNFFSILAGFMEPGESIESAVCREVLEEISINIKNVTYHSSQPWPYPSSLMIGCIAEAEDTNIIIDEDEIVEAKWVERKLILSGLSLAKNSKTDPLKESNLNDNKLILPPPIAIAHQLLKHWTDNPKFFP